VYAVAEQCDKAKHGRNGETLMPESTRNAFGLAGRVCVVTGGGSGIGRATAMALAGDGASVAVLDRDEAGANETARLLSEAGGNSLALTCDVSDRTSVESASAAVRDRFGDAQILVNNAGMIRPGALESLSLDDWNAVLAVNLTGYFICAQVFGRAMRVRGEGALVHVSSVAATEATAFSGAYSVSKAGVTMLSRLLAVEWGPAGIRSNSVCPGMIQTPLVKTVYEAPGIIERRSAVVPSRRVGQPDDIAQAILFLASPRSAYVNGTELLVDGGLSQNLMSQIARPGYERSQTAPEVEDGQPP
jgi:NAD(P)-dependent dehydrogenase (short-subunit alcohol dehydrogenase family)